MNYVGPIKDRNDIFKIENELRQKGPQYVVMFELGIYSGLRVSDILPLKVRDVSGGTKIRLREKKTGKYREFPINPVLQETLHEYIQGMGPDDLLIPGRTGSQPICREYAYKLIHSAGLAIGLDNLGTHSMRKTFGYHYYTRTKDIATLMKIFNHSREEVTLRYIGIEQEGIDEAIMNFCY